MVNCFINFGNLKGSYSYNLTGTHFKVLNVNSIYCILLIARAAYIAVGGIGGLYEQYPSARPNTTLLWRNASLLEQWVNSSSPSNESSSRLCGATARAASRARTRSTYSGPRATDSSPGPAWSLLSPSIPSGTGALIRCAFRTPLRSCCHTCILSTMRTSMDNIRVDQIRVHTCTILRGRILC